MNATTLPSVSPELEAKFATIVDRLDFTKIQNVMRYLGWKYSGERDYPTPLRLRETAIRCLRSVSTFESGFSGTGGFMAHKTRGGLYRIAFEIDDQDSEA